MKASSGNSNKWNEKLNARTPKRFTLTYIIFAIAIIESIINARISEGEAPTKTKKQKQASTIKIFNIFLLNKKEAKKAEKKPIIERCIPDKASTWERPAFLKASISKESKKSLFPERRANKR